MNNNKLPKRPITY